MDVLQEINKDFFYDTADPRVRDLPLMGNPLPVILITGTWLYFVLEVGPKYMATRKPMSLKFLVQIINFSQIIINTYLVYEFLDAGLLTGTGYNFRCQLVDYSINPNSLRIARACYIYTILKLYDYVDTIIFVLRHKTNQVSFLHLYHHVVTIIMSYATATFAPGGFLAFGMLLNTLVHVVMYIYYFVAALGPQYQKYLWWKKYLTRMQLLQFVIQLTLAMDIITDKNCKFQAKNVIYFNWPLLLILFLLFSQFYVKSYQVNKTKIKSL